jgi:hypothetical protein
MIAGSAQVEREESPDTKTAKAVWASRLVTPGGAVAVAAKAAVATTSRKVPQRIYRLRNVPGDSPEENLRDISNGSVAGKGEKVG